VRSITIDSQICSSLELVEDLIIAGYCVGLLPIGRPTSAGIHVRPARSSRAQSPGP